MVHLDRTARKRQSKRRSVQKKEGIRIHSRQMEPRVSDKHWPDRRKIESMGCIMCRWSDLPCRKGGKRKIPSHLVAPKEETDGYTPQNKNSYHPEFRAAIQERQMVTAIDPSAPNRSSSNFLHSKTSTFWIRNNPAREVSDILGGIKTSGILGHLGAKTNA